MPRRESPVFRVSCRLLTRPRRSSLRPGGAVSTGVAARLADKTFFTEEDHRTEDLRAILEALAKAAREEGGLYEIIPDRKEAIFRALSEAREGDTVLLAGKGHERTLERGTLALPWDEKAVALEGLKALGLGGGEHP